MGKASAAVDIPASPNEVWQSIGGFNSLPDWLSYIPKSELSEGGRIRHLTTIKGETIVERLEVFDNTARSYSYSTVQAPFPVTGYLSTIRVTAAGDGKGSRVEWAANFNPLEETVSFVAGTDHKKPKNPRVHPGQPYTQLIGLDL